MVSSVFASCLCFAVFQYSLCRVVLMVWHITRPEPTRCLLSVLALSSRFDGQDVVGYAFPTGRLSVLALSSRFDGPSRTRARYPVPGFQYSLCRVVLMVLAWCQSVRSAVGYFQYSLCRVVLMVVYDASHFGWLPAFQYSLCRVVLMVNARLAGILPPMLFQYSLCRVVLMVLFSYGQVWIDAGLSVLALSSRFDGLLPGLKRQV